MLARTRVHFRPLSKDPCHRGNGMNLTRTRLGLYLASALLWACGDVEIKPDSRSGEDFERAGASQLFFDKLTDDYVDGPNGDNTDWKFFKVPAKGFLKVTVYWDTKDVDATAEIRDRFGAIIQNWTHSKEVEKDEQEMKVEPGTHFIRLHVDKKASVYTMDVTFQAFDIDASDEAIPEAVGGDDLLGEPIPEAMPAEPAPGRPRPRPAGKPAPRPAAAPAGGSVEGTIFRILAGPNNKGSIVTLNVGEEKGIRIGNQGQIWCPAGGALPGGTINVTKVNAKSATAVTAVSPQQIGNCRDVKVNAQ